MRGDPKRQEFSITFDDGPDPVFTLETLAILRDFDVRATFYVGEPRRPGRCLDLRSYEGCLSASCGCKLNSSHKDDAMRSLDV
jgi:hypothetical protein